MPDWSYHATVTACTSVSATQKYSCTIPSTQHLLTTLLIVWKWRKLVPRLEVMTGLVKIQKAMFYYTTKITDK